MSGSIFTGDDLTRDTSVACDVCVIGSGSGGAWLAHELARAGKRVVMLEEGGYHTRRDFDMTEPRAYASLYQELGNRATDDLAVTMFQGRSVGGSTTINWCSSFRTPKRVLDFWREHFGIETLSESVLAPHWEKVERRLRIAEWPLALMNANNKVLWDGLGALGYSRSPMRRNVNHCLNLGYCDLGCPVDAKQSMLVTTIPDAVEAGMTLYANASARSLKISGRKVSTVVADILDPTKDRPKGVTLTVQAKVTALCGGAINSPALLLRSGLNAGGRVGTRTWIHPVTATLAEFESEIAAYAGAPQSVYSHHFVDRGPGKLGFVLEVAPMHPMFAGVVSSGGGPFWQDLMTRYPKLNAMIAICVDGFLPEETGATVKLREGGYGRHSINYAFVDPHWEAFRQATREMAKIQFAAGAKRVVTFHSPTAVVMKSVDDLWRLDNASWSPGRSRVFSAHLMGGCAMGSDASKSVVDPLLRYHDLDNLFVVDGSVFPTSLGVNPQESIFGLAHWAAEHVGAAA